MHRTFSSILFAAALAIAGGTVVAVAQAQENGDQNRPQQARERSSAPPRPRDNSHNSLSDSVRRLQREPGVRVLSAERVPFDGRDINRIKYVDERGRVRYMDDAGSSRRRSSTRASDDQRQQFPSPPARGDNPSQP